MLGKYNGFISLCRINPLFPKFTSYHCIIHQDTLCSKVLPFQEIIHKVTSINNSIKTGAMQHRLFKELWEDEGTIYEDLITYTEVRWLSKARVLERFLILLPQIKTFLNERNEICPELDDFLWLKKLGFLTDVTLKLKTLN
ncbi:General transcription factor II-I repeat domain-containing protein 2, partial [Dictyocoela muelleri]